MISEHVSDNDVGIGLFKKRRRVNKFVPLDSRMKYFCLIDGFGGGVAPQPELRMSHDTLITLKQMKWTRQDETHDLRVKLAIMEANGPDAGRNLDHLTQRPAHRLIAWFSLIF